MEKFEFVGELYGPDTNPSRLSKTEIEECAHLLIAAGFKQVAAVRRTCGFTVGEINKVFGLKVEDTDIIGPCVIASDEFAPNGVGVWKPPQAAAGQ